MRKKKFSNIILPDIMSFKKVLIILFCSGGWTTGYPSTATVYKRINCSAEMDKNHFARLAFTILSGHDVVYCKSCFGSKKIPHHRPPDTMCVYFHWWRCIFFLHFASPHHSHFLTYYHLSYRIINHCICTYIYISTRDVLLEPINASKYIYI